MGSYANCWLGDFHVGSSKNDIDFVLLQLFRPIDKCVIKDPKLITQPQLMQWLEDYDEDSFSVIYYQIDSGILKDRLELLGYTLETCKKFFELSLASEIQTLSEYSFDTSSEISFLRQLSSEKWMSELAVIRSNKKDTPKKWEDFENLQDYMRSKNWYGFPGVDINVVLRLMIEIFSDIEYLIYDVTDLIASEYFDENDDLINIGIRQSADEYSNLSKIVVLTEGKSDSSLLSQTLGLLYPHLSEYYSFMDFDGFKNSGGVGNLVNLVKAFAGAGIVNRTIALFDNDTAALSAINSLDGILLPNHIKVMRLPDLDFLKSYPSIGPSGVAYINVNGLASSLELMMGKDVLFDEEFDYCPIQWTGYDHKLGKYQGEVLKKENLHLKYKMKLKTCIDSNDLIVNYDWDSMRLLFKQIFSAFSDLDAKIILSYSSESRVD